MVHVFNAADSQEAVRRIALGNATSLRSHNDLLSVFTSRSSRRRRDYDSESDSSMDTDEEERVAVIHHLQARHDVQIHQIQFQTPCSGLVAALGCAHECKNNLHDRKADQALSSFVEACSTSIFSLAYLATVEQQLVKTLEDAENRVQMLCWDLPASKVNIWAARLILGGYQGSAPLLAHQLKKITRELHLPEHAYCDITGIYWIALSGRFRALYRVAVQNEIDHIGGSLDKLTEVVTDYSEIKDQMWTTYRDMQDLREQHPITAQTLLMLRELLGDKIENFDMDRVMYQGYRYCMAGLKDPAMALHHLTICMFQSLKAERGRPDRKLKLKMIQVANVIMDCQSHLRSEEFRSTPLWDIVKDRLLGSLLLVGRTFDLSQILSLGGEQHALVTLLNSEHARLQEQMEKAKPDKKAAKRALQAESSLWSNSSKAEEEHDFSNDSRCDRCSKRTRQLEQVLCDKCGTLFCSRECLKRDTMTHKTKCKRLQLKQKHNSQQTSAKVVMSP